MRELYLMGSDLQTLGLGRYLICLQVILLFQRKDGSTYWLLVMISLLQVVMATLFSQGVWFGLLLVVYMLLGFSAMTLLMLHRQWERYRAANDPAAPAAVAETGVATRWPLTGQRTDLAALQGRRGHAPESAASCSAAWAGSACRRWPSRRCCSSRFRGPGAFFGGVPIIKTQPVVGFNETVTLGQLGQMIESRDEVMRVRFSDYITEAPEPRLGEIYLQGALLTTYDNGKWQMAKQRLRSGETLHRVSFKKVPRELVRVEIAIDPSAHEELFFVAPYVAIEDNLDITVDPSRGRVQRARDIRRQRFEYTLGTTAIVDGAQRPLVPMKRPYAGSPPETEGLTEGAEKFPFLVSLARQWLADSGLPEEDRIGRMRYLEQHLAASGKFQYSLAGEQRDPSLDPVEDFLTNHPRGNCEYFATALALMLRSQGIPSRLVVGYRCDEWNAMGKYYQVRQMHAHAWVQAYLAPDQVPKSLLHGVELWPWSRGAWLQLDPTPASGDGPEDARGWLAALRRAQDWLDSAWSNYVVELDYRRQREAIYRPVAQALQGMMRRLSDPGWWRAKWKAVAAALHVDQLSGVADWLMAAFAAVIVLGVLAGGGWLLVRFGRRLWAYCPGSRRRRARRTVQVEFYRRLENLLARRGLVRVPGQTQREFAAVAGVRLAMTTGEHRMADLPALVADAFYLVRFGGKPLDSLQSQAVEHALAEMASAAPATAH